MSPASPATDRGRRTPLVHITVLACVVLLATACTSGGRPAPTPRGGSASTEAPSAPAGSPVGPGAAALASPSGTITLYTSVTQATVDAAVGGWTDAHPGVDVEVFRAPTAEVAARIATDLASGGLRADVLWLTDPLSIAAYADQGLLQAWTPPSTATIPAAYRTGTFFGTRLLNMVLAYNTTTTPAGPSDFVDLLDPEFQDAIGIPDPGFAGSAFAALAWFSQADGYGMTFYRDLKLHGATQVKAPDDVTTGVAEGRFKVGMTLDNSVRTAVRKGSPIALLWPSRGAIAIYSPIAVVGASTNLAAADSFVDFTLSLPGQALIAGTGWQPVVGPGGPPVLGPQVSPDWTAAFGRQKDLLASYRTIFGG
ncbi:MAG TPA: extracellular solute-binding protein [Candidatus Deferrimicrobium sp.]|nr:extracellular solute-binding protein [Candidatus Deferrimicrobium sp.]